MKSIIVLTAALLITTTAQANPKEQLRSQFTAYQVAQKLYPKKVVRVKEQILGTRKMSKGVARYMRSHLDWGTHAELAFRDWDKLNATQKQRFVKLLKRSTTNRYAEFFSPSKRYMVQFGDAVSYIMVRGNQYARVKARVTVWESQSEIEVAFLLRERGNRWVLCDIYIDGVSKARALRSAFRKIFKEKGFDGVVKALQKNIRKNAKKP